jgi:hypothetical protein
MQTYPQIQDYFFNIRQIKRIIKAIKQVADANRNQRVDPERPHNEVKSLNCPECNGKKAVKVSDTGEICCINCGLVLFEL